MFSVVLVGIAVVLFGFVLRLATFWKCRHRGCDAYYFLLSSETFRAKRQIPIVLPNIYALEQPEQWYPPGFSMFLSFLPERWLQKFYWVISPAVDCVILVLTYGLAYGLTGNLGWAVIASVLYAINTAAMSDCTNLNSRLLGSLLFTVAVLCFFAGVNDFANWWYLVVLGVGVGVALLFTHKLSSQLFYVMLPAMSFILWDPVYVLGLVAVVLVALLPAKGFVIKVWRAQKDILGFWAKHWPNLGAHQIYGSPMYSPNGDDRGKMFQKGLRGMLEQVPYLGMNPAIVLIAFPAIKYGSLSLFEQQLFWWVVVTYVFASATVFVKKLRFLGEGRRYLKLAAVPLSYLAILPLVHGWSDLFVYYWMVFGVVLVAAIAIYWRLCSFMNNPARTLVPFADEDLTAVTDYLKGVEVRNILCIPESLADEIGYYCRKPVLRGTHNTPFKIVEVFFPVHRIPVDYAVAAYGTSHIVVFRGYVAPEKLEMPEGAEVAFEAGNYTVYEVKD